MVRRTLVALALMAAAVVLGLDSREDAGPAAGESAAVPRSAETRVGRVRGTEAYIAVLYDGRRLRAYACDGSARRPPTVAEWFEAVWDSRAPVTMVSGGVRLRVERLDPDGRIRGRLDGHRFTATPATGPAGLDVRDGARWIRLADGSVRGAMVSTRPRKCRFVQVTGPNGTVQWVSVCG